MYKIEEIGDNCKCLPMTILGNCKTATISFANFVISFSFVLNLNKICVNFTSDGAAYGTSSAEGEAERLRHVHLVSSYDHTH